MKKKLRRNFIAATKPTGKSKYALKCAKRAQKKNKKQKKEVECI